MVDVRDKNVFLSGPMTGIESFNALEFVRAHLALERAGADSGLRGLCMDMLRDLEGECKPYRLGGLDQRVERYAARMREHGIEVDR